MALTLNAEQKYISDIFSGKNRYIIPRYQRPYSWDIEQCSEMFEDIEKAYQENYEDGYFLGNIVIARNNENRTELEVIDGQQRLITLTLLLTVLYQYDKENQDLKNTLWVPAKRKNLLPQKRLITKVFQNTDPKDLEEVLSNTLNDICRNIKKTHNNFKKNICYFKNKIDNLSKTEDIEDLTEFIMEKVYLLPIETTDDDQDSSRQKALKIFETINNRGLDLSSSDIFKARLYSMALYDDESENFINLWDRFATESNAFNDKNYDIDRIFKIYSFIIRGQEGNSKSEVGLMSFFNISFFKNKNYSSIMKDLLQIIECIQYYKECIVNPSNKNLTKWFQLINEYTNNYPKDTLIVYIFKNGYKNLNLESFSENLVRYCYFKGSTTSIKNDMYKLNIEIMEHKNYIYIYYPNNIEDRNFDFFGRLYKGYGLLSVYINKNTKPIYPYYIRRLRDMTTFKYTNYSYFDEIGHTVIVDSKKLPLEKTDFNNWDKKQQSNRKKLLKNNLIDFFTK